ncbi:5'-nucleotidase, lipoprotein e(P4) family [Salmonella enterica subsp. enterica serovar Abony]|nr:5'-nucleotidase, lipoprotein e(P4) family [Salmonella enterica subsp. enterica serovar Richmond]EBX6497340.1 5'-nucleotidase, lipoprotein e(P4) family [Salmonella enterica subsp. enterica serovar Abony]EJB5403156.1 5'-nucleotidase, lipoprotein e(P4) family [Salmonella enterica]ELH0791646.1 5'-nucleotidase, lipoprotein e(P4) family [Salmonella enterica]HAK7672438.1 5'-nucleotidase, lipoprotein e(P4) family [Salmonella enterica]
MKLNRVTAISMFFLSFQALSSVPAVYSQVNVGEQEKFTEQYTLPLIWVQKSGEFRAIYYQAFNLARLQFCHSANIEGKKKAVIVDLDETMLNNSPYTGWEIKSGHPFSSESWKRWNEAKAAIAMPGAVEFSRYVTEHGGRVFYVSNRNIADLNSTVENLNRLGFPDISRDTVFLKDKSPLKEERFNIIKRNAYNVVLYIGDNLNDFTDHGYGGTNQERISFVENNKNKFGIDYIILPNPLYGGWENGINAKYNKSTLSQKVEMRKENINAWDGK